MGKVSRWTIGFFVKRGWFEIEDRDQYDSYVYVLYTKLLRIFLWTSILALSIATRTTGESVTFLLAFTWLRMVSGGYHSESAIRCFLLSLASYFMLLLCLKASISWQYGMIYLSMPISLLLVFCLAPRPHANDPKSDSEIKALRRYSRLFCIGICICLFAGAYFIPATGSYLLALALGMDISSVSLLVEWIKERKHHEKENHTPEIL